MTQYSLSFIKKTPAPCEKWIIEETSVETGRPVRNHATPWVRDDEDDGSISGRNGETWNILVYIQGRADLLMDGMGVRRNERIESKMKYFFFSFFSFGRNNEGVNKIIY